MDHRGFSVPFLVNISGRIYGELAELVDALDLGSSTARRKGSSPLFPTRFLRLFKKESGWLATPSVHK